MQSKGVPEPDAFSSDVFPSTDITWLGRALEEGGRGLDAAREHVMRVYAHPLRVYVQGSSFRTLAEPGDLVRGFFADRLSRRDYLLDWRRSGRPLRRWLMTGFRHFLHEQARLDRRWRRPAGEAAPREAEEALHAFDRATALSLVREALAAAEARCAEAGQEAHWRIFLAHFLEGRAYDALPEAIRVEERRAGVMARTASNKFKDALRELVGWPGATAEEIDEEIHSLMQEIASS